MAAKLYRAPPFETVGILESVDFYRFVGVFSDMSTLDTFVRLCLGEKLISIFPTAQHLLSTVTLRNRTD